ncbi:MAG: S8 family peptidase [Thermoanaerobaculales bacterium]
MTQRQFGPRAATLLVAALIGFNVQAVQAKPAAGATAGTSSSAMLLLPPETRAWPEKVAREVAERAAQSNAPVQVLITFRVPDAIRRLEVGAPGAPARLRWIADTGGSIGQDFAPYGIVLLQRFSHLATAYARVPPDALPALAADDRIDEIVPVRTVHALDTAGRDYMRISTIQPPYNGAGVGIAILDSGVDSTVPELSPVGTKTILFYDAYHTVGEPAYAKDDFGHGTEVAGIAAAIGVNAGTLGVAPNATVVSVKVLDSLGNGDDVKILGGINAILASIGGGNPYNIRVANMSFGGYFGNGASGVPPQPCDDPASVPLVDAFTQLSNAGVVPVVAAGNGGCTSGVSWPACISTSLAVGAVYDVSGAGFSYTGAQQCNGNQGCTDNTLSPGMVACFSDSGEKLDVWAPTCSVAPRKGGGYDNGFCGTSASAPYAAGLVALLAQAQPGTTAAVLKAALRNTGTPVTDTRNGLTRNVAVADQALAGLGCTAPPSPAGVLGNKTTICLGESLVLSWSAVAGAASYTVQVATDPSFTSPSSTDTTSLSFVYSSTQGSAATFYLRVRTNLACGTPSAWSSTVSVAYTQQCQVAYSHTYFVSGIARLPGVAPAFWYADLAALNPGSGVANLRLTFYGTATPPVVLTTVGAHAQMSWPDVLATLFGDSGPDKGVILLDADQPIEVLSRTYSKVTNPSTGAVETFGQQYQGMEANAGLVNGSVGYLANLRSDGVFRTNVEFVNVGAVTTDVEFRFYTNAGVLITTVTGTAAPQRWGQLVRALPSGQAAAFAEVRALAPGARILASASVIDGNSTDPTTIPLFVP